jgi:hypothetical protein
LFSINPLGKPSIFWNLTSPFVVQFAAVSGRLMDTAPDACPVSAAKIIPSARLARREMLCIESRCSRPRSAVRLENEAREPRAHGDGSRTDWMP